MKTNFSLYFLDCNGLVVLSNDGVGVARVTVFQETRRPGAGFKIGDFVVERLGGLPKNDSTQREQIYPWPK